MRGALAELIDRTRVSRLLAAYRDLIGLRGVDGHAHLDRLAALLARYEPQWFSEHLAWSRHGPVCLNDLLPVVDSLQAATKASPSRGATWPAARPKSAAMRAMA